MYDVHLTNREYPYIVQVGDHRNTLIRMDLFVRLQSDDVEARLRAFGMLQDTPPTEVQRRALLDYVRTHTTYDFMSNCIVWSPTSCTYVPSEGPVVDSARPPVADHCDARDYYRVPYRVVDCTVIRLPEECFNDYVSVRLIDADHVEVATAAPAMIGYLDENPGFGAPDPIEQFLNEDQEFVAPTHFRGVKVTGVAKGPILLGPIQPDSEVLRIVPRCPQNVFQACREVAERDLSDELLLAVWRAVEPVDDTLNRVGVLLAA